MVSLRPRRQAPDDPQPPESSLLVGSGLLVPTYYAAQALREFGTDAEAVDHYLLTGRVEGLLPNPVHDFDRVALPTEEADVVSQSGRWPVRDGFARDAYLQLLPASAEHPGGPAGHFLQAQADGGTAFGLTHPDGRVLAWTEVLRIATARAKHLKAVLKADAFDRALYEAQVGRTFASDAAAVWHYLERGEDAGLSPTTAYDVPDGPAPDLDDSVSRFARAVRRGQLSEPASPATRDRAIAELARRVAPVTAAAPPWSPTGSPQGSATSDRLVSVLARAADLTRDGVRNVESLTQQTHTAWELVVALHPHAHGRVRTRAGRLAAADERVRIVEVDPSLTTTSTLLDVAEGEVVAWWDGASRLHPRLLELGLSTLSEGVQVVSSGSIRGDDIDDLDPLRHVDPPAGDTSDLLSRTPRGVRGVLATREVAEHGPDPLHGAASGWSWLLATAETQRIAPLDLVGAAGPREHLEPRELSRAVGSHATRTIAPRRPGTTAVVVPGVETVETLVRSARAAVDDGAVVVVVVDSTRVLVPLLDSLASAGIDLDSVVLAHLPSPSTLGLAVQRAVDAVPSDTSVLISPAVVLTPGAVPILVSALSHDTVAATAVVLSDDETIASAGIVADGREAAPRRLLAGHPSEDAVHLGGLTLAAAEGHAMAIRTATLDEHPIDPGLDDWAVVDVTARAATPDRVRVADVVLHLDRRELPALPAGEATWAPAPPRPATSILDTVTGFTTSGWSDAPDGSTAPALLRAPATVPDGPARGLPALRWALKLPSPPGPRGSTWGDTFFAADLARALRRLGQEVVTDRRTAHHRASGHLDDVVLSLRGLVRYRPQPGTTSVLWVISHPDLVDAEELAQVDLAYAASEPWSQKATQASGRRVSPLLQAADTSRFTPGDSPRDGIVFVGRPRRGSRRVVTDAIDAGATLDLYGEGWDELVDARHARDAFVPNDELPGLYRRARIVLNDHWPDMAAEGFWSNRTFEALASGALVVSDEVAGGADLFGGLVRGYRDVADLGSLLAPDADGWPDAAARAAALDLFTRDHGFDARARTLLADVLDHRGVAHHLTDGGP